MPQFGGTTDTSLERENAGLYSYANGAMISADRLPRNQRQQRSNPASLVDKPQPRANQRTSVNKRQFKKY